MAAMVRRWTSSLPTVLIVCIGMSAAATGATGATFAFVDNVYCRIALMGPVELGDAAKLQSAIARVGVTSKVRFSICLNSLGGDYEEGLKMGRLLLERGVGTVVLGNRQCYSACAFLFMFGSFIGTDGARWPNRRLAAEGALGFHAPYLPGSSPEGRVAYSINFQNGVRSIGRFLTTLYDTKDAQHGGYIDRNSLNAFFAPELLAALIGKGPDEAFMIRTVDDAGMWDIDVMIGGTKPALDAQNILQACTSLIHWQGHAHARTVSEGEAARAHIETTRVGKTARAVLPDIDELTHESCLAEQFPLSDGSMHVDVRIAGADQAGMTVQSDSPYTPEEIAWTSGYDKSWYALPPATVICGERCAAVRAIPLP